MTLPLWNKTEHNLCQFYDVPFNPHLFLKIHTHGVLEVTQVEQSLSFDKDPLVIVTIRHQYHFGGLNGDLPVAQQQVTLCPRESGRLIARNSGL